MRFAACCGMLAAVGYMLANVCLRSLADLDPVWVSCIKAVPTVVVCAPLLLRRALSGQLIFPSLHLLGLTLLAGVLGQLVGNVCFQWSLGVIGIALAVPINLGAMIVSGAILGQRLLGDRVTPQMAIASLVLILAICVLSLGAATANASLQSPGSAGRASWLLVAGGVTANCLSGIAYSVLGVVLRYTSNRHTPVASLLFTIGLVGIVLLGSLAVSRHGWSELWTQSQPRWGVLLAAGVFNVMAFWALTKALQHSSVLFVNALNASQTALAALAGVLVFHEPLTLAMVSGVVLTAIGLLQMRGRSTPKHAQQTQVAMGSEPSAASAQE